MLSGKLVKTITSDGLELAGFFVDKKSEVAIFQSHGTAGDFYTHKFIEIEGELVSKKGISFLTANNRGHDVFADIRKHDKGKISWTTIGGGFERFEDCLYDIKAWLDFLEKQGVKKVILQGHSLSQKALYYFHKTHDIRVIGIIQLSPQNDAGLMYYSLGPKKYEETNKKIAKMVKEGKGNETLPKEFSPVSYVTSAQMYSDYLTENGVGTLTPYHNPQSPNWKIMKETKIPMLVVFGSKDLYMKPSPQIAAEVVREKTKGNPQTRVMLIKDANHSYIGYEQSLSKIICDWITKTYSL